MSWMPRAACRATASEGTAHIRTRHRASVGGAGHQRLGGSERRSSAPGMSSFTRQGVSLSRYRYGARSRAPAMRTADTASASPAYPPGTAEAGTVGAAFSQIVM